MENAIIKSTISQAVIVGAASLIAGSVGFKTACVVGATYGAVASLTKPFFKEQGIRGAFIPFLANTILTTGLVNLLGLSLKVSGVAWLGLLPLIAMGKILAFGMGAMATIYLCSKAIEWCKGNPMEPAPQSP